MQRNFGIDALKILSMFMIVILHILGQGGILANVPPFSVRYFISWYLEIMCLCSVNCFAIASGYLSAEKTYSFKNIIILWLQVFFYSVLIIGAAKLIKPEAIDRSYIKKALFPTMSHSYWYFTAYFGLYLFMPLLNIIIEKAPKNILLRSLFLIIGFTCIGALFDSNLIWEAGGYSCIWLMLMYLVGGAVKKYNLKIKNRFKGLALFFVLCGINFAAKLIADKFSANSNLMGIFNCTLLNYTSPFIAAASIQLFFFLEQYSPKHNFVKKTILFFAPLSFGVYLIHTNIAIWNNLLTNAFVFVTGYLSAGFVFMIFASAVSIFIVCALIDYLRAKLFKLLKVHNLAVKSDEKIKNFFNKYIPKFTER